MPSGSRAAISAATWVIALRYALADAAAPAAKVSGSTSMAVTLASSGALSGEDTRLEVNELLEGPDLFDREAVLESGQPIELADVAREQRTALVGGNLLGHAHRLLAVVGPVRVVEREVTGPHEMGVAQSMTVLHRRAVLVEREPRVAAHVLGRHRVVVG